jgi:uncharacterized repeat protein (TIGR02543 family)
MKQSNRIFGMMTVRILGGTALLFMLASCPGPLEDIKVDRGYRVEFDTHGGTEILPKYFTLGSEVYPHSFSTHKDGHTLTGWFDSESGGSRFGGDAGREKIPVDRDMVFHAQWGIGAHTVRFITAGGAEVPPAQVPHNGTLYPSAYVSTRADHGFAGWWDESENTQYREPFSVADDISLYARWVPGSRTVRFVSNGGNAIHAVALQIGNSLDLNCYIPVKAHSGFAGWHTDEACADKVSSVTAGPQDITLYAKWEAGSHTVSFNTPGGSTVPALLVPHNGTINPANYVSFKEGYGFAGWFKPDLTTQYTSAITVDGDLTLYAAWDYGHHTVRFVTGSGAVPIHPVRAERGNTIDLSTYVTSKSGSSFAGWWDQETGGIRYAGIITVSCDLTFYAHWNAGGGENPVMAIVSDGASVYTGDAVITYKDGTTLNVSVGADGGVTPKSSPWPAPGRMIKSFTPAGGAEILIGRNDNSGTIYLKIDAGKTLKLRDPSGGFIPIGSCGEFQLISGNLSGSFIQEADLDLLGNMSPRQEWTPIGDSFHGTFDGANFSMYNIFIYQLAGDSCGLFKNLGINGTLKNINLRSGSITAKSNAGGIVAVVSTATNREDAPSSARILNCSNGAFISASTYNVGGIAGSMFGTIDGCSNNGEIAGDSANIGGICGSMAGPLTNSVNFGNITAISNSASAGGITGSASNKYIVSSNSYQYTTISGCSNSGNVTGARYVGGIAGYCGSSNKIGKCVNTGNLTASYSGSPPSDHGIGGIAGYLGKDAVITACYNTGMVTGTAAGFYTGGIVGDTIGKTIACYNTGPLDGTGNNSVGGIAGYLGSGSGTIACYSTAAKAGATLWGIAGTAGSPSASYVHACYWSGDAATGIGFINGSGTFDVQRFADGVWPGAGSGTGKNDQWGTGGGTGDNTWWRNLGGWNGGSPQYPKLCIEY